MAHHPAEHPDGFHIHGDHFPANHVPINDINIGGHHFTEKDIGTYYDGVGYTHIHIGSHELATFPGDVRTAIINVHTAEGQKAHIVAAVQGVIPGPQHTQAYDSSQQLKDAVSLTIIAAGSPGASDSGHGHHPASPAMPPSHGGDHSGQGHHSDAPPPMPPGHAGDHAGQGHHSDAPPPMPPGHAGDHAGQGTP